MKFGYGNVHADNWRDFIHGQSPAFYIVLAIILGLVFYALSQLPEKTTSYTASSRENAWAACTMFVEKQLGVSASEAEKYYPLGVTLLGEDSYQVDVHYAKLNTFFRCELKNTPDGNWQLISVKAK